MPGDHVPTVRGEVIEHGAEPALSDALAETVRRWTARHRRSVRAGGAVAVVVTLVAGGVVTASQLRGPALPRVSEPEPAASTGSSVPDGADVGAPLRVSWDSGPDGEPVPAPVSVRVRLDLAFRGLPTGPGARVQLLDVTGPGLVAPGPGPAGGTSTTPASTGETSSTTAARTLDVPASGKVDAATVDGRLDCAAIALPVPPTGFGVRVRVREGGRTSTGVVPLPRLGARLAAEFQTVCGHWLARRSVLVTQATATVHPRLPRGTVRITVGNRDSRPARVRLTGGTLGFDVTSTSAAPSAAPSGAAPAEVTVPGHGSATVDLALEAKDCTADPTAARGSASAQDLLGIRATLSPRDVLHGYLPEYGSPDDPTGLRMSDRARAAVTVARSRICGGWGGEVSVIPGGALRRDRGGRQVSVPIVLQLPTRDVQSAQVIEDTDPAAVPDPEQFTLLPTSARSVPDRAAERIPLTLVYRAPATPSCPPGGTPALPLLRVMLLVRTGDGVRSVPVGLSDSAARLDDLLRSLCA